MPGPSTSERLVAVDLVLAERHVAGRLTRVLAGDTLDAPMEIKEGTVADVAAWVWASGLPCTHARRTQPEV